MATHGCWSFLPVKQEFFLPTVANYLLLEGHLIVGIFFYITDGSLLYNIKADVLMWCDRNTIELNYH